MKLSVPIRVTEILAVFVIAAISTLPPACADPSSFAADALARLNYYRTMAKLPPIALDLAYGAKAAAHARYLVDNGIADGTLHLRDGVVTVRDTQEAVQWEDRRRPSFSNEGAAAGTSSFVMTSDNLNSSGAAFIDQLTTFPFSTLRLFDPQFSAVGIGSYCVPGFCETVLVPRLGLDKDVFLSLYVGDDHNRLWRAALGPMPREQQVLKQPIVFPPDGSTIANSRYPGGDYIPIEKACAGYTVPTGPAIVFELGKGDTESGAIAVTNQNVSMVGQPAGQQIDSCVLTAKRFCAEETTASKEMCEVLTNLGAAVIMPRNPLAPGRYVVSLEADSRPYQWSFTVASTTAANSTVPTPLH